MKYFEVGYWNDPVCSVNLIWANTGEHEREAVQETAQRRAEHFGYEVLYVKEITEEEVNEKRLRGMPYYTIDEEAEHKYDPSFVDSERRVSTLQARINRADERRRYWCERVKSAKTIGEFSRAMVMWNAWFEAGFWNEKELEIERAKAQ